MKNKIRAILLAALLSCTAYSAAVEVSASPITVFHFFEKEGSGPPGAFWKAEEAFRQDHPEVDLDLEFVDSGHYSEILNIMMAGGELPDIWLTKADKEHYEGDDGRGGERLIRLSRPKGVFYV